MTQAQLDLSKNLTEKRIPAELQGHGAYRLIVWEADEDTGGRVVRDIYEGVGKFAIFCFNKNRGWWSREGYSVSLEPAVYA